MGFLKFIDSSLLNEDTVDARYINSPFKDLKNLQSRSKGSRFEKIASGIFKALGHTVQKPESTDYDVLVNGKKYEIKGSTLAKGTNVFSFLQIRPDQDYDYMMFMMFFPEDLEVLLLNKQQVLDCISKNIFKKQHGGKKAESGTYCFYGTRDELLALGAVELK